MRNNLFKFTFLLALVAIAGFAFMPSGAIQAANYSGSIDGSEPTSGNSYYGSGCWTDVIGPYQVAQTGDYDYIDLSIGIALDMTIGIYDGSYNPADPYANSIASFDDYGTVTLTAATDYYFAITPLWDCSTTPNNWEFSIDFSAPVNPDADSDGVFDASDNCVNDPNPTQADMDNDGIGDACDNFNDNDNDGIENSVDNCPANANNDQADVDNDGIGDVCDGFNDNDNDTVENSADNCPDTANPFQEDVDNDGIGDACDGLNDNDGDGIANSADNCVAVYNPTQADPDGDGRGEACDNYENVDNRLNPQQADLEAVLYPARDDAGNPAMQVYCTTADATGYLAMIISQVDLPETAPAENTLIATTDTCNVEFWALAEGSQYRFQVNVGPDDNGNIYELLFNTINGTDMEMRSFNQYELD